jgi:hypothetical protein
MMYLIVVNQEILSIMKPFKNMFILCIISCYAIMSSEAQVSPNMRSRIIPGMTSLQVGYFNLTHSLSDNSLLSFRAGLVPTLTDMTLKPGNTLNTTNINYYDLINTRVQLNSTIVELPVQLTVKEDHGAIGSINFKWEGLKGVPFIDPAIAYYCPYKRTDELTLCGSHLYHVAAYVISGMLEFNYQGANRTLIYPPAYMQPRYTFIDTPR